MNKAFWFNHGEVITDAVLFIAVAVAACAICKILYDWKERRRLEKELADYQQRKEDEM